MVRGRDYGASKPSSHSDTNRRSWGASSARSTNDYSSKYRRLTSPGYSNSNKRNLSKEKYAASDRYKSRSPHRERSYRTSSSHDAARKSSNDGKKLNQTAPSSSTSTSRKLNYSTKRPLSPPDRRRYAPAPSSASSSGKFVGGGGGERGRRRGEDIRRQDAGERRRQIMTTSSSERRRSTTTVMSSSARRRLSDRSYAIRKKKNAVLVAEQRRSRLAKMRREASRRLPIRRAREREQTRRAPKRPIKNPTKKEERPEKNSEENKENKPSNDSDEKSNKSFINLKCPHCDFKATTFRRYELHLTSKKHLSAMKQVAAKLKTILAQMRQTQRNIQNELEKKETENLEKKTAYCPLCKLNYKQRKSVHQASDSHKRIRKFLLPHCLICNVSFKSPMMYEAHCCSIRHLKRKERIKNAGESEEEVDLNAFTTIDSIEEDDDDDVSDQEGSIDNSDNIGADQIKKIEIYHCNLCKIDLPRAGNKDEIITNHCKSRNHLKQYIKFKEGQDKNKNVKDEEMIKSDMKEEVKDEALEELVIKTEEKDIADVEKDLASILVKADVNSDDDMQINGDRFNLSENTEEVVIKEETAKD